MPLSINAPRLKNRLEELSAIGRLQDYGIYRMAFSDGDMQGRDWFKQQVSQAGLALYEDGAANIHARLNWRDDVPSVMSGSHLDTVPGAGHLDGAMGVLVALECLQSMKEQGIQTRYPLEAVAFTDEEGRFGGMFGSQALTGKLTPESIHNAIDLNGVSVSEAMKSQGLNAMDALHARRSPESIHAFVEMHIEQGPVLDQLKQPIGVVEGIVGLFRWDVNLKGVANHAGTTPMNMRNDAFSGLAEFSMQIPRILEEFGTERSVTTIGRVELSPGAANVVPGNANFSLEVRDTDKRILEELHHAYRRSLSAIARRRGLMFEFSVISEIEPVKCDSEIMRVIKAVSEELSAKAYQLPSGAAHDTQMLASITRAGMVFVPSKAGRSHSAAEWTDMDDIILGANVMLNTIYTLAEGRQ